MINMKFDKKTKLFGVALAVMFVLFGSLLAIGVFTIIDLSNEKSEMSSQLSDSQEVITQKGTEINSLKSQLNSLGQNYSTLETEKEKVETEKEDLSKKYSGLQEDINATISDLDKREALIDESLKWFKDNSSLPEDWDNSYKLTLKRRCFDIRDSVCRLHLGCLFLVNEKEFHFKYKDDRETDNEGDQLLSLQRFIDRRGGDCEDYSLFVKAEINDFLNKCGDLENKRIEMLTYADWKLEYGEYTNEFVLDFLKRDWYLSKVDTIWLKDYKYPVIVCGDMYDLQSDEINGHCILAISKEEPTGSESLFTILDKAPLIEPQTGEFMGYLNDPTSEIYLKDTYQDDELSYIFSIITNDDYYIYSEETEPKWSGYSLYKNKIAESNTKLADLLNSVK